MCLKVRMRISLAISVVNVGIAGARERARTRGKLVPFVAHDGILYHLQIENGLDQLERGPVVGVQIRPGSFQRPLVGCNRLLVGNPFGLAAMAAD